MDLRSKNKINRYHATVDALVQDYNENHGPDGRFASGPSGSTRLNNTGGGYSSAMHSYLKGFIGNSNPAEYSDIQNAGMEVYNKYNSDIESEKPGTDVEIKNELNKIKSKIEEYNNSGIKAAEEGNYNEMLRYNNLASLEKTKADMLNFMARKAGYKINSSDEFTSSMDMLTGDFNVTESMGK